MDILTRENEHLEAKMDEVLSQLRSIKHFPARKDTRLALKFDKNDKYYHFALGLVRKRTGEFCDSVYNKKYPELLRACRELIHLFDPDFRYETIQVNRSHKCKAHRDLHNTSDSLIIALGDYTGGDIEVLEPLYKSLDINRKFEGIDGRKLHQTADFQGERYSLVYFCITNPCRELEPKTGSEH